MKIVSFLAISTLFLFNSCSNKNNTDTGVVINGVKWATRNVATPGTFATNPYDIGNFYQWNSNVGWSSTGAIGEIEVKDSSTTWNSSWTGGYSSPSSSNTWTSTNDPSPAGWRVPTYAEIQTLLDTTKVATVWTTQNGVNGKKFTDKTTGNSIFLPASNCLYYYHGDGVLVFVGSDGNYWSSTGDDLSSAYNLSFGSSDAYGINTFRAFGLTVRPVAK